MNHLKINLLSNFAGTGWLALMQLIFVPLYIKFMGIEAYGLVGFYIMLQGVLRILDFGLSPTMNREMARYSVQPEKADESRDFVRTLEVGYWAVGLAIGVVVCVAAPIIATHWIKAASVPTDVVEQAVISMGVLAALQWPLSLYQGGLLGLQRQPLLNGLKIVMSTLSNGGVALVLWLVSSTIKAFFLWQIAISAVQVILTTVLLWRSLPPSTRAPRFNPGLVRSIWRFAAGISGITLSGMILTQLDKVILSNLLSLEFFGYYMLANVVGNSLSVINSPVFYAIFPRFSALVVRGDEAALKQLYHGSSQLAAVLTLPIAAVVAFFPSDVLFLWTGNAETARNAAAIVSVFVIGSALNGLMNMPYALQLAYGWTRIGLHINMFLVLTFIPVIFFMVAHYGAIGAAAAWVLVNSIYILVGVPLTHGRLLKGEGPRWFAEDVGLPLAGAMFVALAGWVFFVILLPSYMGVVGLCTVLLGALGGATLAASQTRAWTLRQLSRIWMSYGVQHRPGLK